MREKERGKEEVLEEEQKVHQSLMEKPFQRGLLQEPFSYLAPEASFPLQYLNTDIDELTGGAIEAIERR